MIVVDGVPLKRYIWQSTGDFREYTDEESLKKAKEDEKKKLKKNWSIFLWDMDHLKQEL